ncbi:MAG TPA: hypothetical protein PK771_07780 [Spirochaetota bacterium]|nr:hypothetical protein [Spirochaetota bacterium]
MKAFVLLYISLFLIFLLGCPLPEDNRISNKISDVNVMSGFVLPSKIFIDKLTDNLYVFDKSKGVYKIPLSKIDTSSNSNLSDITSDLLKPENSVTYYNINSQEMQTKTDIYFYTVDFCVINDGSNNVFYSIVKANFDPDKKNDNDDNGKGTQFAGTDWYYIYMYKDASNYDLQPLSYVPDSSTDVNYKTDSSSYVANSIYVIKNAIYLSCGANEKALRYIQLKDDYTISENFRQNKITGFFERVYATYENAPFKGIINSGKVIATDESPSYIFLTSKDDISKGIFVYKDENPSDYKSIKQFKTNIKFPDNVYPYNISLNPFNKHEFFFSSANNIYNIDISKINSKEDTPVIEVLPTFFSEKKSINNFYIFEDTSTGKKKIACSIYNSKTIPDSTEIKIFDLETKSEEKSILVEGLLSYMLVYNGCFYGTNESTGKLIIKKL